MRQDGRESCEFKRWNRAGTIPRRWRCESVAGGRSKAPTNTATLPRPVPGDEDRPWFTPCPDTVQRLTLGLSLPGESPVAALQWQPVRKALSESCGSPDPTTATCGHPSNSTSTVRRLSERLTCPAPTLRLHYRCRGPREQPTRSSTPAIFVCRASPTPACW